jgi:integrase
MAVLRYATHWDEVVTALGYGYLRRHDLRHTGLTWMADAGVPVPRLAEDRGPRVADNNPAVPAP